MFWTLYLAHLIGDYPLQTDWMVQAKRTWWGLTFHVSVHLAVMLVLVGPLRTSIWPYLLVLTIAHAKIDAWKNLLLKWRSHWITWPYILDQILHLATVLLVAAWIERTLPAGQRPSDLPWMVYAVAYVLATQVWYITERLLTYKNIAYQLEVVRQSWTRMAARALLLTTLVGGWQLLLLVPLAATADHLPYLTGTYRRRALLTDLIVVLTVMILLQIVQ